MKKRKHLHFLFSVIPLSILMVVGFWYIFFIFPLSLEFSQAMTNNDVVISAVKYTNGLDGKMVNKKSDATIQVVGVMIDNHPDAYPESSVAQAKIVYEAPVEGGFTRYMAIFDVKQKIAEVGPVRSARSYFIDWLQEYGDGLYMHSGGSPQALDIIKNRNVFDANEFFWGEYYWRSPDRVAPHNLYTSSDSWQKIVGAYGDKKKLFTPDKAWKYSKIVGKTMFATSELKIRFVPDFEVAWTYDSKNLNYTRSVNRNIEKDKDGSPVQARNILVQFANVSDIASDDKGRKEIKTVGTGKAIILKKGSVTYGTWAKLGQTYRTRFYNKYGGEVLLAPGNTWVEVVPQDVNVEVSN